MFILDFSVTFLAIIFAVCAIITTIVYIKKKGKYRLVTYWLIEAYLIFILKIAIMPVYILDEKAYADFTQHIKGISLQGLQPIPFETIKGILEIKAFAGAIQIVGNILLLMPLAFIVVWIVNYTNKKVSLALGLVATCLIETIQLLVNLITRFPCHAVDVDDLILNYAGYLIAILIIYLIKKYLKPVFNIIRKIFVK